MSFYHKIYNKGKIIGNRFILENTMYMANIHLVLEMLTVHTFIQHAFLYKCPLCDLLKAKD